MKRDIDYEAMKAMEEEIRPMIRRKRAEEKFRECQWANEWNKKHLPPYFFDNKGLLKPFDELERTMKEDMKNGILKPGTGYQ